MRDSNLTKTPIESAYFELLNAIQLFNDFLDIDHSDKPLLALERLTCYVQAHYAFLKALKHVSSIPECLDDAWLRDIRLHLVLMGNDFPELPAMDSAEFLELATPEFYEILRGAAKELAQKYYPDLKLNLVKLGIIWRDEIAAGLSSVSPQTYITREQLFDAARRIKPDLDDVRLRGMIDRAKASGTLIKEGSNRWIDCGWERYVKEYRPRRSPDTFD